MRKSCFGTGLQGDSVELMAAKAAIVGMDIHRIPCGDHILGRTKVLYSHNIHGRFDLRHYIDRSSYAGQSPDTIPTLQDPQIVYSSEYLNSGFQSLGFDSCLCHCRKPSVYKEFSTGPSYGPLPLAKGI